MKKKILETRLTNEQIALFFLGQMGYLIKFQDKYILIDGYLSDYVDRNCATPEVPWIRKYPAPMAAEELDFVDYVFCTHLHYDHADPYTLSAIAKVNAKAVFFASRANTNALTAYGITQDRLVGLDTDKVHILTDNICVTAIPAAHEEIHYDASGNCLETGFLFNLNGKKVYHSGDCCPYEGLEERVKGSNIMILPVNGRDWYRTVKQDIIGCFDAREATLLAKHAGADLLVPSHIGLYDVNTVSYASFVDCVSHTNPMQSYHIFTPGERYVY